MLQQTVNAAHLHKTWVTESSGDKIFLSGNNSFLDEECLNIVLLTQWQYWWWFWFTLLTAIYFMFGLRVFGQRTLNNNPHIVTSYRARGRWGDLLICAIPIFWCVNILTNSHHLLRVIEWQSETALIVLRVRGKQWYWIYKYDLSNYYNPEKSYRYVGRGKKIAISKHELYRDTVINTLKRDKANLDRLITTSMGGLKLDIGDVKRSIFLKKYKKASNVSLGIWEEAYRTTKPANLRKPTLPRKAPRNRSSADDITMLWKKDPYWTLIGARGEQVKAPNDAQAASPVADSAETNPTAQTAEHKSGGQKVIEIPTKDTTADTTYVAPKTRQFSSSPYGTLKAAIWFTLEGWAASLLPTIKRTIRHYATSHYRDNGQTPTPSNPAAETADTPVETADTPVETADTPVETADTPVETADTPVETADTPVETADTPVETADTPVETADTSVETADTSVETADTSVEAQDTSVEAQDTSVKVLDTPVEAVGTATARNFALNYGRRLCHKYLMDAYAKSSSTAQDTPVEAADTHTPYLDSYSRPSTLAFMLYGEYAAYAYPKLPNEAVDTSVEAVDTSVEAVDTSVEAVDTSVEAVDTSVEAVDTSVEAVDTSVEAVDTRTPYLDSYSRPSPIAFMLYGDYAAYAYPKLPNEAVDTSAEAVDTSVEAVDTRTPYLDSYSRPSPIAFMLYGDYAAYAYPKLPNEAVDTSVEAVDTSVEAVDTSVEAVDTSLEDVDTRTPYLDSYSRPSPIAFMLYGDYAAYAYPKLPNEAVDTSAEAVDTSAEAVDNSVEAVDTRTPYLDSYSRPSPIAFMLYGDYAAYAYPKLPNEAVDTSVEAVDTSVEAVDTSVEAVDTSVEAVDTSLEAVDTSVEAVDTRTPYLDSYSRPSPIAFMLYGDYAAYAYPKLPNEAVDTSVEAVDTSLEDVDTSLEAADTRTPYLDSYSRPSPIAFMLYGDYAAYAYPKLPNGAVDTSVEAVDTRTPYLDSYSRPSPIAFMLYGDYAAYAYPKLPNGAVDTSVEAVDISLEAADTRTPYLDSYSRPSPIAFMLYGDYAAYAYPKLPNKAQDTPVVRCALTRSNEKLLREAVRSLPKSNGEYGSLGWPSPNFMDYLSEKYSLKGVWSAAHKESTAGFSYVTLGFQHTGNDPKFSVTFNKNKKQQVTSLVPLYGVVKQKKSPRDFYTSKVRARLPRNTINFQDSGIVDNASVSSTMAAYYKSAVVDYQTKNIRLIERMRGKPMAYMYPDKKRLLWVNKQIILPTETPITIITNSFDVMHSWFIPGLALKLDCVPGRSTHHTIYIENPGYYYGQCAEICGRRHHHMPIKIYAVPFFEFLFWWRQKYVK